MCNFTGLWHHSDGGCDTVDQQHVASLLERLTLELARKHARSSISSWTRDWPQSRSSFVQEVIPTLWRFRSRLNLLYNFYSDWWNGITLGLGPRSASSILASETKQCNGGGEAQRMGLQIPKIVSSNLTRCSNYPYREFWISEKSA